MLNTKKEENELLRENMTQHLTSSKEGESLP